MGHHWTADEFRQHGREAVDWVADYLERLDTLPATSTVAPGETRAKLPAAAPEQPEEFTTILKDLDQVILAGITHWQSPRFFGYFPANASGPAALGDLVSAGLGVQGMSWSTSPACTELETHILDWLVKLLGLPERFLSTVGGGVIQDSASSATLCALLCARERATGGDAPHGLVAYSSTEAHSSVEKAVRIAGLGRSALRRVGTDSALAMSPAALRKALVEDLAQGLRPCFLCATVGSTSTLAVDPVPEIAALCSEFGLWLHIDAAMAGTAAICPEYSFLHAGVNLADSYAFNPHKWMLTNFDCNCFFVADRRPLLEALSILPEYLRNPATESGAVIDYRDWQVPLGRRFRALKLWFVLRSYGAEGIRAHVRRHVAWTERFAAQIHESGKYEHLAPQFLNLVCFAHLDGDAATAQVLASLNEEGRFFLTHTRIHGRLALRVCIGGTHTTEAHVQSLWQRLQEN